MSLSLGFRQQLATLVQAHDQGCGPVEAEAVRRLTAGLPITALQVHAFAEKSYPTEIRSFLDAHGYRALYERDVGRALAAGAGNAVSPTGKAGVVEPRRSGKQANRWGAAVRVLVLAMGLIASGLILKAALPSVRENSEAASTVPANVVAQSSSERSAPASPCVQSLRDEATTWCEGALSGSPIRDARSEGEPAGCGNRLKVNSDTVRLALNRILEENATYTYRYDEARERCAAAALIAAP